MKHIKPLGTRHYRVVVLHPTKPEFFIESARTGVISQVYKSHAVYNVLADAHTANSGLFNHLCKKEMKEGSEPRYEQLAVY